MEPSTIVHLLDSPARLEQLYRDNPRAFARAFTIAWDSHPTAPGLSFWQARLDAEGLLSTRPLAPEAATDHAWRWAETLDATRAKSLLGWTVGLILLGGFAFKLPVLLGWTGWESPAQDLREAFHSRYAPFYAVLPLLGVIALRYRTEARTLAWAGAGIAVLVLVQSVRPAMNLTGTQESMLWLSTLHLPMLLVAIGSALALGSKWRSVEGRMSYLQLIGEAAALAALLLIGGILLTMLAAALFGAIGMNIWTPLSEWIVPFGLIGVMPVGLLLASQRPQSARVAPLVARVFGPMALVVFAVYLPSLLASGALDDRDALLTLNVALLAVLGLLLLIEAERPETERHWTDWVATGLVTLALAADVTAFIFVAERLASGGLTPNRLAVVGLNALIAVHFAGMVRPLWRRVLGTGGTPSDAWTARYLTVYTVWGGTVVLLFPLMF